MTGGKGQYSKWVERAGLFKVSQGRSRQSAVHPVLSRLSVQGPSHGDNRALGLVSVVFGGPGEGFVQRGEVGLCHYVNASRRAVSLWWRRTDEMR